MDKSEKISWFEQFKIACLKPSQYKDFLTLQKGSYFISCSDHIDYNDSRIWNGCCRIYSQCWWMEEFYFKQTACI